MTQTAICDSRNRRTADRMVGSAACAVGTRTPSGSSGGVIVVIAAISTPCRAVTTRGKTRVKTVMRRSLPGGRTGRGWSR